MWLINHKGSVLNGRRLITRDQYLTVDVSCCTHFNNIISFISTRIFQLPESRLESSSDVQKIDLKISMSESSLVLSLFLVRIET